MVDLPIDGEGHLPFVLDYLGAALEPSILIGVPDEALTIG